MDYKKEYEEALERAKSVNIAAEYSSQQAVVEYIFPKLKENNDDEKIRKAIIRYLNREITLSNFGGDIAIFKEWIVYLEKQGEQNPTNKFEPKFKAGDYIINEHGFIMQIDGINNNTYIYHVLDNSNERLTYDITKTDKSCHLWTIQDAKDGDVLYTSSTASNEVFIFKGLSKEGNIKCYCSYDSEDKYCEGEYHFIGKPDFTTHPATKEKCNLLFKKMKEAGYEWDAEKKELKKIKQDDNTYTIVEKEEKKVTYNDIARKLFSNNFHTFYINNDGDILDYKCVSMYNHLNNCISKKQAEKLLAINKLMNVAKYLNGDWQLDWEYAHEKGWYVFIRENDKMEVNYSSYNCGNIYFKSKELANQAIEILGEETIKLALCTDY